MKKTIISLLLIISFNSFIQAQTEIARNPLDDQTHNFFQSEGWADEAGYLLTRFQYASGFNAFRFIHREKGELSSFAGQVTMSEILGYTSTDSEFTLYFKGFALNKRGYYFLAFFKNSNRAPILNGWLDKAPQGDHLFSYSAFGKLYIVKEDKGKLNFVEVTDYGKSRVIPFQVSKDQLKALKGNKAYLKTSYPDVKAIGREQTLLCYKDSIVAIGVGERKGDDFKRFTALAKLDYTTGIMSERQVSSPVSGSITSKILGDRLYQLRFNVLTTEIGVKVYQYPSLKLLNEFEYKDGEEIAIKTSPLIREDGKNKENNWADEKRDRKVMNELLKGTPYLSVQHNSTGTQMLIESRIVVTYTNYGSPGGVGSGGAYSTSSDYIVGFDACFSSSGDPCLADSPKTVYYQATESFTRLKEKNPSYDVTMIENSFYVYNILVSGKTKEYLVEEFKK